MAASNHSVIRKSLEEKIRQQNFRCALTGEELTPPLSSLDHIDPRCIGGSDEISNVQIVLPCVNRAKSTMTQGQFVAMCHAVARTIGDSGDRSWVEWTGYKGVKER
jgi:5-methylcytosine-specific restriction endonuclease McrA